MKGKWLDHTVQDRSRLDAAGLLVFALALAACTHDPAVPRSGSGPPPELGRWVTASGNLEVEIAPCGDRLCGTVVRVLANRSMSKPGETMAPVDALQTQLGKGTDRSPLGMQILTDFTPSGDGEWEGHIYNREDGKTYSCFMELLEPNQLKVRPYKYVHLFGKTQVWHRVAEAANGP